MTTQASLPPLVSDQFGPGEGLVLTIKNVLIAVVLLLVKCYDSKKVGRPYSKVAMCYLWTSATQQKKKKKKKLSENVKRRKEYS